MINKWEDADVQLTKYIRLGQETTLDMVYNDSDNYVDWNNYGDCGD